MAETSQTQNQPVTPPTDTPPSGVDKQAIAELAAAMQDLRTSVDSNTTQNWNKPLAAPIPTTQAPEPPSDVDFSDPAAVKKYINDEMTRVKMEANKAYVFDQARRTYDQLIDQEFPDMQYPSSAIYRETIREVRKRMGMEGVTSIEEMRQRVPSVFYDAACAASVRLTRSKRTDTSEGQRLSGLTGGYIEGGINPPPPPSPPSQITPEHRYFADKFGIDPKVIETTQYTKGSDGVYRLASKK